MSFDKLIQFKALSQIYGNGADFVERIVDPNNLEQAEKAKMRNVCALIAVPLFDRLEGACALLDLTKRQFIEAALIEALDKADKIIEDEGVFRHFETLSNSSVA
jgi:hypothetical protein